MSVPTFPCKRDGDLLMWAANFGQQISSSPAVFGVDAAQASAFQMLSAAYADAYALATNPTTNSKANVNAKNQARWQLLNATSGAKQLVAIVQAFPGLTDTMRGELGLRLLDVEPSPVPAPAFPPGLAVVATVGRMTKLRLRDQESPDSRGKPRGVEGATVLYHVGDEPPASPSKWMFGMNTSRPVFDLAIPGDVPAGSKVWITAFWFNARKDSSPPAQPKSVRVSEGLAQAA